MFINQITHKTTINAIVKHKITEEELLNIHTLEELKLFSYTTRAVGGYGINIIESTLKININLITKSEYCNNQRREH